MAKQPGFLPEMDSDTLAGILRRQFRLSYVRIDGEWECKPLSGGARHSLGVYRVTGQASIGQGSEPWSLILKICPGDDGDSAPDNWLHDPREALAYRSGLVATLPAGLSAPACFEVSDRPDGTVWVWLEEVRDDRPGPWALHQHVRVARELGRFTAGCLAAPPPDRPWLRRGVLRNLVDGAAPTVATLDAPTMLRPWCVPSSRRRS
jgi:hypothetical protein